MLNAQAEPLLQRSPEPVAGPVEVLFRKHNDALLAFLRARLQNEADAREAAQEAYVRLLQLDRPDQPSFLRAYLFRIATNVATDMLRKRTTRGPVVEQDLDQPEPALQERTLAAREELKIVEEALNELPPRCREAFLLNRHEGWTTLAISVHLQVSDRMVRLYLARALEHAQAAIRRADTGASTR